MPILCPRCGTAPLPRLVDVPAVPTFFVPPERKLRAAVTAQAARPALLPLMLLPDRARRSRQGRGLGYRFAKGGHDVALGSRSKERAVEAAAEFDERAIVGSVRGADNADSAAERAQALLPYKTRSGIAVVGIDR